MSWTDKLRKLDILICSAMTRTNLQWIVFLTRNSFYFTACQRPLRLLGRLLLIKTPAKVGRWRQSKVVKCGYVSALPYFVRNCLSESTDICGSFISRCLWSLVDGAYFSPIMTLCSLRQRAGADQRTRTLFFDIGDDISQSKFKWSLEQVFPTS